MNPIIRGVAIYLFLLVIFRIMGKRSMSEITTFDFILLLIIGEATQQALLGNDFSITNAFIVIISIVAIDICFSLLKGRIRVLDTMIDSSPLILVNNGKVLHERMKKTGVDEADILEAARLHHGLERIDEVKYAVLERDGAISIIPFSKKEL